MQCSTSTSRSQVDYLNMTHGSRAHFIASVVVTFNRLNQLKTTVVNSLAAGADVLVVVNNASTDGTLEWLQKQPDPRLVVLNLPVNIGGAGGFYEGFKYVAEQTRADWLVCYDDDAYPVLNALEVFRGLTLPSLVAGVAAAVYLPDGRISEMNRPSRDPFANVWSFTKLLLQRRSGFHVSDAEYEKSELVPIDFSSFVGCFLRVQVVREHLGLPRKELFIYADDIMYTHGINQCGMQHMFAPKVHFVHDCGTLHQQLDVYKPMWKVYYTYRNRVELFRQVAWVWVFYPIAVFKLITWLAKVRHYDDRAVYLRLTLRAWWDGMCRNFTSTHKEVMAMAATSAK